MENNFVVVCNVCGSRYHNWTGSTPCCGSIAYMLDEKTGEKTDNISLFGSVNGNKIEPLILTMKK